MRAGIKSDLQRIIDSTEKLSFPILINEQKKRRIIEDEKNKILTQIQTIITSYGIDVKIMNNSEEKWEEAQKEAYEKFDNLHDKYKINSFYLQEVMHLYSYKLCQNILENVEKK